MSFKIVLIIRSVRKAFKILNIYLDSKTEIYIYFEHQRFIFYYIYNHLINKIDDIIIIIKGKGFIIVTTHDNKEVELTDIYYVLNNQYNIISMAKLAKKGYTISFKGKFFDVKDKIGKTLFLSQKTGNNYLIPQSPLKY